MKSSAIASLFMILGVTVYVQAMPTYDAPDTIPQTKPIEAQHQLPNLEVMGERKKRCSWNSDPTTTTAGYSDPHFGHPPKAWDPVEPFEKTNKYFGTTRSPIRKKRSMDLYDQHQLPHLENLQVMGERKKRCSWNSDPTTTTAGYSDPHFGHPPKAWDPVEPFEKTNKYFGTTRSPIRKKRSMDGMKVNYTLLK